MATINIYNPFRSDWTGDFFSPFIDYLRDIGHTIRESAVPSSDQEYWYTDQDGEWKSVYIKRIIIFEDDVTKRFRAIETGDFAALDRFRARYLAKLHTCDFVLKCQYREWEYDDVYGKGKIRPYFYRERHSKLIQEHMDEFRCLKRTIPKMYFRGAGYGERSRVIAEMPEYFNTEFSRIRPLEYYRESCKYKLNLALSGFGGACHREFESMACGTPVISKTFRNSFADPLIPNFHYIEIAPYSQELTGKALAEALRQRFEQVINDDELQSYVVQNACEWYDRNLRIPNAFAVTAKLLGLENPHDLF